MTVEQEASFRAELLSELSAAQAALEDQVETLRHAAATGGDAASLAIAQNQLQRLAALGHRIDHAAGGQLASIRAEVTAVVAASHSAAQQSRSAAASGHAAEQALHAATDAAHRVTADFMRDHYERKIFDPYLRFASAEDEQAYRQREEERRREIEKAQTEGTPEAELRALKLAEEQLKDAGAHGADRSPIYAPKVASIREARANLEANLPERATTPEKTASAEITPAEAALDLPPDVLAAFRSNGVTAAEPTQDIQAQPGPAARDGGAVSRGR